MKKPLVIYHGNCADGFAAAWCFWSKFGDAYEYFPGVYMQPPPDCIDRDVYLVDFCYKRPVVETMLAVANAIVLIDHHKSALEDLAGMREVSHKFFDYSSLDHSGAMLAWKYLNGDVPPPPLLGHIEDRDFWRFKLPGTREIQADVFSYEYTFEQFDKLMHADRIELTKMTVAGAAIMRKHDKDIAELIKVCQREMLIGNLNVPVASLPYTMVSDAANIMARNALFAACYWDTPEGRVFGLRSVEGGMDVSEIAKMYGGRRTLPFGGLHGAA